MTRVNLLDGKDISAILSFIQRVFHVKIELKTKFQMAPSSEPATDARTQSPIFLKIKSAMATLANAPAEHMR